MTCKLIVLWTLNRQAKIFLGRFVAQFVPEKFYVRDCVSGEIFLSRKFLAQIFSSDNNTWLYYIRENGKDKLNLFEI